MQRKLEAIELDALATVTGGLFGSAARRTDEWNKAYRSGKPAGQAGSTVDWLNKDAKRPLIGW